RAYQAEYALLDEIRVGERATAIAPCDRRHQAQVGLDHEVLGGGVAALDPPRQADLVGGCQDRMLESAPQQRAELVVSGRDLVIVVAGNGEDAHLRPPPAPECT